MKLVCRVTFHVFAFLVVFTAFTSSVSASDNKSCGRDLDRSGTIDNLCAGNDRDEDGETVADGDCDDTDPRIMKGWPSVKGAPTPGDWRVCRADGGGWTNTGSDGGWFTSSDPYCPKTSDHTETVVGASCSACFYFNYTTGDNSRTSTQAQNRNTPWKTPAKFAYYYGTTAPPGTYVPAAGNCFINDDDAAQADVYDNNNGLITILSIRGLVSGSNTQPYQFLCSPGKACKYIPSSATANRVLSFLQTTHWIIRGGDRGYGAYGEITSANELPQGIVVDASCSDMDVSGFYIHDIDGVAINNNAAITHLSSDRVRIHHNSIHNNYDREDTPDGNNYNLVNYRGIDCRVDHNDIILEDGNGGCWKKKHSNYADNLEVDHNICVGGEQGAMATSDRQGNYHNNLIIDGTGSCFRHDDLGGPMFSGGTFDNNTCINTTPCHQYDPERSNNILITPIPTQTDPWVSSTPPADDCTGNYQIEDEVITDTICIDDASSAYTQGLGFLTVHLFGPDQLYADVIASGKFKPDRNGYYNTNSASRMRFDLFATNDGNTTCAGRGVNGSAYTTRDTYRAVNGSLDPNSLFSTDPQLDAKGIARGAGFENMGWRTATQDTATTTTTSVTTTTTGSSSSTTSTTAAPSSPNNGAGGRGGTKSEKGRAS